MSKTIQQVKKAGGASDASPTRGAGARYTCADYRDEMRLMGMQRRLEGGGLGEDERRCLEQAVVDLQRVMAMD